MDIESLCKITNVYARDKEKKHKVIKDSRLITLFFVFLKKQNHFKELNNQLNNNKVMKQLKSFITFFVATFVIGGHIIGQNQYTYKTYPNDPLQVREYTLDNGLKVFMSVYKDRPTVQTYIAVRAIRTTP